MDKNIILNHFFKILFGCRTKVECAGQCLLTPSCSAFQTSDSYCRLLDSTYLYRDKTDTTGTPIYMVESKSAMQGKIF